MFFRKNNNELMWSLYANKHTGFCVAYNIEKIDYNQVEIEKTDVINGFAPISAIYLGLRVSSENEKVFKDLSFKYKIKLMKAVKEQITDYNLIKFEELIPCRFHELK